MIDVVNPDVKCQSPDSYPKKVEGATGGLALDKVPVVCGGFDHNVGHQITKCFSMDSSGKWFKPGHMTRPRSRAASILWNSDTLWITGGFDTTFLKSTELLTIRSNNVQESRVSSKPAPDLPVTVGFHCLLKMNDTTAFLIGGSQYDRNATLYFDLNTNLDQEVMDYSYGPTMSTARYAHVCGLLVNPGDDRKRVNVVVAAGGNKPPGGYLTSTELLIGNSDHWISGPDMPEEFGYSSGLTSPDGKSLLVTGGLSTGGEFLSSIYRFGFEDNRWQWNKMTQELQMARRDHFAMLIPDYLVNCTSPVIL